MRIEWFTKKTQGSVSIMLCVLMLPMVLFSSLVIDTSRIYAAKTAINGAGDLAMNARLSEYDKVLYELYGIFASCDTETELKTAVTDYFRSTIERTLGDSDKNDIAGKITDSLLGVAFDPKAGDSFDNLVSLSLNSDNGFSLDGIPSSVLANPTVLKRQIIETMKYRGPVSIASTLLNKIGVFKNSGKQTEVFEKKIEYSTELDELTQLCLDTYRLIAGYKAKNEDEESIFGYNQYAKEFNDLRDKLAMEKVFAEIVPRWYYLSALTILIKNGLSNVIPANDNNNAVRASGYGAFVFGDKEKNILEGKAARETNIKGVGYFKDLSEEEIANMDSSTRKQIIESLNGQIPEVEKQLNRIINIEDQNANTVFRNVVGALKFTKSWGNYNCTVIDENKDPYCNGDTIRTGLGFIKKYIQLYEKIDNFQELESPKDYFKYFDASGETINLTELYEGLEDHYTDITQLAKWQKRLLVLDNETSSNYVQAVNWLKNEAIGYFVSGCNTYRALVDNYGLLLRYQMQDSDEDIPTDEQVRKENAFYDSMCDKESKFIQVQCFVIDTSELDVLLKPNSVFGTYVGDDEIYNKTADKFAGAGEAAGLYYSLLIAGVYKQAVSAQEKVKEILEQLDKIEKAKENWKNSYEQVDDGALKASMENDYKATTEVYNKAEIIDFYEYLLKKIAAAGQIIDAMDQVTFGTIKLLDGKGVTRSDMEQALYSVKENVTRNDSLEYWAGYTVYTYYSCPDKLRGYKTAQWVDPPKKESDRAKWLFYKYKDKVDPFPKVGYVDGIVDGEKNKASQEEKFWYILKKIGEAVEEDYQKTDEQKTQQSRINDTIKKQNKDLCPSATPTPSVSPSTTPAAAIDIGTIYSSVIEANKDPDAWTPKEVTAEQAGKTNIPDGGKDKTSYKDEGKNASSGMSTAKKFLEVLADLGTQIGQYAYEEEFFTELFTCKMDEARKTKNNLFNVPYNTSTAWYGKEIEFILWGDSNLDGNMTKNYATIYVIRLAINAIYAFTASDIQSFAYGLATAIAGWTFFGVPIVQAIITIGLALAESAVDLEMLKAGKDVVIMKSANTFVCSPAGIASEAAKQVVEGAVNYAKDKIIEGVSEVVDGLTGTIGDNLSKLEDYVNGRIQKTMDGIEDQVVDMITLPFMERVQPICQRYDAQIEQSQQMVDEAIDEVVVGIGESIEKQPASMLRDFELQAYNYLKSNVVAGLKSSVFDAMQKYKGKDLENKVTEIVREKVNAVTNGIASSIKKKTEELKKEALDKLYELKDKGIEKFTGYMDETMGKVSDKINGTISDKAKEWTKEHGTTITDNTSGGKGMTMNYKEYCKLFVIVELIAGGESVMLQRAAALMEANVRAKSENSNFTVTGAYTMFLASGSVKMRTLLPWGMEFQVAEGEEEDFWDMISPYFGSTDAVMQYRAIGGY